VVVDAVLVAPDAGVTDDLLRLHLVAHVALHVGAPLEKPRPRVPARPPGNQGHHRRPSVDAARENYKKKKNYEKDLSPKINFEGRQ